MGANKNSFSDILQRITSKVVVSRSFIILFKLFMLILAYAYAFKNAYSNSQPFTGD